MRFFQVGLLLAAVVGISSSSAQAGLLPVSATVTAESGGNYQYSYSVSLDSSSTLKSGDYFTIYDVAGYVNNSASAPAGWTATSSNTGTTPSGISVSDSATTANVTYTYTGSTVSGSTTSDVGTFSYTSTSGSTTSTMFASQTHTSTGSTEGSVTSITPTVTSTTTGGGGSTPQTPEPATLVLLGLTLPILGARRLMSRRQEA